MKQVVQNLKSGATEVVDAPAPLVRSRHLLIATRQSLISAGSERTLVEFGHANLIGKARSQPDKVKQVLDKIRTDGLLPTLETVFARLDQPMPLGYCNAGVVIDVGSGVMNFSVGDRVVSNGNHAEIVCVPQNLCARIPDEVTDDTAAFTVLASIALQGIRLVEPTLGESVAVVGMGVIGLLTVQMLLANGCRVLAIDFNAERLALASQYGAKTVDLSAGADPIAEGLTFSDGNGMDAVIITAATDSNKPMHQAAQMSRKRGRIVLVGVVGLSLSRADFYEKELTFQVSCSYGPGRYDETYEQRGQDYPYGFVRWTEQRNFQAVLELMASGKIDVSDLIARHIPLSEAAEAYRLLLEQKQLLGLLLTYPETPEQIPTRLIPVVGKARSTATGRAVVGMIGAGSFATMFLLPAITQTPAALKAIASSGGTSAALAARKFEAAQATSDYRTILDDPEINTVFIATRHNSHAQMVVEALEAGKHVFVEKPLALKRDELSVVREAAARHSDQQLMVGFNRRFSALAQKMHRLLNPRSGPLTMTYMVNAGAIPFDHWVHDPAVGGGRIIGEGCHFIDLLAYFAHQPLVGVAAQMIGSELDVIRRQDKMTILVQFADGSIGTVHYFANGSKRFPKERVEVFSEGRVLVLDNFKSVQGYGWPHFKRQRLMRQDKGHKAEVAAFIQRVMQGGEPLIPWADLAAVTLATFQAVEQAHDPLPSLMTLPDQGASVEPTE